MMMFTSQLGSVEKYPAEAAVKRIANHLRKLQEELEYRLSHLDSTNIGEINADETTITGGIVSLVSQSVGEIAALKLTGRQLEATVEGLGERISSLVLDADSIRLTVEQQGVQLSTLKQTADGITATVQAQGGTLGQTLRLSADGVTITNAAGSALTIDGGQINAKTINTADLNLTGKITFAHLSAAVQDILSAAGSPEAYLESIGVTYIDGLQIQSPSITGGRITGSEIYGGMFSDLAAENYMTVWTSEYPDVPMVSHMMAHYVGDASSSVPLTAMGWVYVGGETPQWMLMVLGSTILTRQYISGMGNVIRPKGIWDFSEATVIGL